MDPFCRVCKAVLNSPMVVLADMPLTDDFVSADFLDRKEFLQDIKIFECSACGLVQNPTNFDHEGYYRDYRYSSGNSAFTQNFMRRYAEVICGKYERLNKRVPASVLEVGSGDGGQLRQFKRLSAHRVLGVEPSEFLARLAMDSGIPTQVSFFGAGTKDSLCERFDICVSSYTLDHVRNPLEYLQAAHALLSDDGLLAFEVHDLEQIVKRTEYCLFEHEHTIYLSASRAVSILRSQGFDVVAVNPLPAKEVRGNSLIVIAQKKPATWKPCGLVESAPSPCMGGVDKGIAATITRIDDWISALPGHVDLVGFGAGGRGVMTLAALKTSKRFSALFDSNHGGRQCLTPKTRIPIYGPERWAGFSEAYCLVFSFGYIEEITQQLCKSGFSAGRIISLFDFLKFAEMD